MYEEEAAREIANALVEIRQEQRLRGESSRSSPIGTMSCSLKRRVHCLEVRRYLRAWREGEGHRLAGQTSRSESSCRF